MGSVWRTELESWLSQIEVTGSCLDVGGAEKPVRGRTKTWNVDDYKILDKQQGSDVIAVIEDDLIPDIGGSYDNIFCLETLMYTIDPARALLRLCDNNLNNLYISNPLEGYGETKPAGTDMVRLFPNWFEHMLPSFGMEIVEMKVVYPGDRANIAFNEARQAEGYKMITNHRSGILIHAKKV